MESLKTLSFLLSSTLTIKSESKQQQLNDVPTTLFNRLTSVAATTSNGVSSSRTTQPTTTTTPAQQQYRKIHSNQIRGKETVFFQHVLEKIPTPLVILLNLIPSNKSAKVRKSGVEFLCKSILVDTYLLWDTTSFEKNNSNNKSNNNNSNVIVETTATTTTKASDLIDSAFECLVTILGQDNTVVSDTKTYTSIMEIIQMHRRFIGESKWETKMSHLFIPRIFNVLESLQILAKSKREIELGTQMKLICGYLCIIEKNSRKRKFLAKKLLDDRIILQSLVDTFALDIDVITDAVQVVTSRSDNRKDDFNIVNACTFRYMKGHTISIARKMIQAIANILTPKQIALFVDACIAQIFDALNEMKCVKRSLCDKRHCEWLYRHQGLIVIANELLKCRSAAMARKSKITLSLATSIIPIIFSKPLWQLPTSLEWAKLIKQTTQTDVLDLCFRKSANYSPATLNTLLVHQRSKQPCTTRKYPEVSASALHGNSMLTAYLMELVGTLSTILQHLFDSFLPTILHPLLQKTSDINSDYVQQAAFVALSRISTDLGHGSIGSILSSSCNYLMETITSELLSPPLIKDKNYNYEAICFHSLHQVIELTMSNLLHEVSAIKGFDATEENLSRNLTARFDETHIILLVEMVDSMIIWFNRNKGTEEVMLVTAIPLGLMKVFVSSAEYINEVMIISKRQLPKACDCDYTNFKNIRHDDANSCLYDLLEFKKKEYCSDDESPDDNYDGRKGFALYHDQKDKEVLRNEEVSQEKRTNFHCTPSRETLKRVVNTARRMLSLSCVFLSITNITIQRTSCDMITNGVHLLSTVECISKSMGKDNGIGNSLLESINDFWNPLRSRLLSSGEGLTNTSRQQVNSCNESNTGRHLSILFSNVLDITAILFELSSGFMVDKFKNDVWPVMAEVIHHFLQIGSNATMLNAPETKETTNMLCDGRILTRLASWQFQALLSALECIQRVFSGKEAGFLLSQLVPTIGAIILPLLSESGIVGDTAMNSIKTLLYVDSDSLWRSLLMTSGTGIPDRPIFPLRTNKDCNRRKDFKPSTILEDRSVKLLNYARNLPEQSLL